MGMAKIASEIEEGGAPIAGEEIRTVIAKALARAGGRSRRQSERFHYQVTACPGLIVEAKAGARH
jgi:hypothetical protein